MAASIEFIKGARGHPVSIMNSYTYHKSTELTNGMKLTCSTRKGVKWNNNNDVT